MKWIKFIILCCVIFMISCHKEEIAPIPEVKPLMDIFTQSETSVADGQEIMFKLSSDSTYIIKLVDKSSNQVISKEKILGKIGENKLKIYTKSIQNQYLYLILENINKQEIKKTIVIVK